MEGINSGDEGGLNQPHEQSTHNRQTSRLNSKDLDAKIHQILSQLDILQQLTDLKALHNRFEQLSVSVAKAESKMEK